MPAIIAQDWPTIFDPETCVRKGQCPLKQGRRPHEPSVGTLYFEQHGNGPERVIFIMGYSASSFAWAPQVEYFGRTGKHSVLVFDNRGAGNSDVPDGLYTTSQMAEDTIDLLDYVGWKDSIHVVGLSLGGMIAQAIHFLFARTGHSNNWADYIPDSLKGILISICAALIDFFSTKAALSLVTELLFPCQWLDSKNIDDPASKQTNREISNSVFNNYFKVTGHGPTIGNKLSQGYALITHHVIETVWSMLLAPRTLQHGCPKQNTLFGRIRRIFCICNGHRDLMSFLNVYLKKADSSLIAELELYSLTVATGQDALVLTEYSSGSAKSLYQ
ncbi:hypothetical protein BU17DRAFT_61829 [Hysterangium stoloniferum]|nr:hypothetical protein BU17DRAFT_61829 [Hysterangium stoloniferum]